ADQADHLKTFDRVDHDAENQPCARWIRKCLAQKARLRRIARRVSGNSRMAFIKLCDDSFEEHAFGQHGLNTSPKSIAAVDAFSAELRAFTIGAADSGVWNGELVEGFVACTHVSTTPGGAPYAPGATFFFMVKFDEPHMLYRGGAKSQRCCRARRGAGMKDNALPKGKLRRAPDSGRDHLRFGSLQRLRQRQRSHCDGRGFWRSSRHRIVRRYLPRSRRGLFHGLTSLQLTRRLGRRPSPLKRFLAAVKSAIAVALAHIFGFGHTQGDDVRATRPAHDVTTLLVTYDVVIAKNTSSRKLVAEDVRPAEGHCICGERIAARDDLAVRRQDGAACAADIAITWSAPSGVRWTAGTDKAMQEEGKARQEPRKKKTKPPRYYALLPEADLDRLPVDFVAKGLDAAALLGHLVKERRATRARTSRSCTQKARARRQESRLSCQCAVGAWPLKPLRYYALLPEVDLNRLLVDVSQRASARLHSSAMW
ncbi:hypothetical protein GGX14DRAFT_626823, partial [Mycena pura]